MRRELDEVERYKNNPIMYIISPRIQVRKASKYLMRSGSNTLYFSVFQEWFYRQQLMLLVLFVNLSLAFMFFKLLT